MIATLQTLMAIFQSCRRRKCNITKLLQRPSCWVGFNVAKFSRCVNGTLLSRDKRGKDKEDECCENDNVRSYLGWHKLPKSGEKKERSQKEEAKRERELLIERKHNKKKLKIPKKVWSSSSTPSKLAPVTKHPICNQKKNNFVWQSFSTESSDESDFDFNIDNFTFDLEEHCKVCWKSNSCGINVSHVR